MIKYFTFLLTILVLFFLTATRVNAATFENFGQCPNPGGTSVASYSDGNHGIVGDYTTHTGSDNVFQIEGNNYTQCFCPTDPGMGMQTNWLNAANLSDSEIATLENSGWIFVGNGADWGLTNDPYLAQNVQISCGNTQSGGAGGGTDICANIDGVQTSVPDGLHQAGPNCIAFELGGAPTPAPTNTITGTGTGGQVLGAATLADTGSLLILPRVILSVAIALVVLLALVV